MGDGQPAGVCGELHDDIWTKEYIKLISGEEGGGGGGTARLDDRGDDGERQRGQIDDDGDGDGDDGER